METQQASLVTVSIDNRSLGVFDTRSGGDVTAEPAKRRPGGMQGLRSHAALPDYDDVTVGRAYERIRDHELLRGLRGRVGRAYMLIAEQPLDEDGNAWGRPTLYYGRLAGLTDGEADSESGDVRMFELTMTCYEVK
jgi:hypothetical protein